MFNVLLGLANPKFDLGVMITASHNPGIYNGFKLTRGDCLPYGLGSGLELVRDAMPDELPGGVDAKGSVVDDATSLDRYIDHIVTLADLPADMPDMKVVIDAGNGMAGHVVPQLLERCPWIKAECLFMEPDGNFPNHEANPLKEETLEALKRKVKEVGAVCGIAFDGDADRVGFVDENGKQIRGDLLTALFANIELRKRSGGLVLSDTRASWTVAQAVESAGGKLGWCKVGHANIKLMMRETGAAFGGELSMHYYFGDLWNVESGDYAMLVLLKELAATGKKLSAMRQDLMHYHHSGEINFEVKDTKVVLQKIKDTFLDQATSVTELDGIRCEFGDPATNPQAWWFSVRTSNTEPLVRLNLEATTEELMKEKVKEISKLIQTV
jgi:phosphomannomutase